MMAAEVKLFGHQYKRWQVGAVVAGGAAVSWYAVRQHQKAATATAQPATVTDPGTGQQYPASATDPLTGMSYGNEIATYGSVSAAEAASGSGASFSTSAFGTLGGSPNSFGPTSSLGSTTLGTTGGTGFATDADWDQAATAGLAQIGYTESAVSSALGRYLAGLSLDPTQQNIVNVALGEFGPPPTGALPIIAAPGTGTASSGDGSGGSGSGGSGSSGGSSGAGTSTVTSARVVSNSGGNVVVQWGHSGPATQWNVTRTGPGGTVTNRVSKPEAVYENLARGHNFEIRIQPLPTGTVGGIDFKTN